MRRRCRRRARSCCRRRPSTGRNPLAGCRPFGALEHDVDHTGDGVGAVLRGSAVAQYFHTRDGGDRNGVQIHRRRATANRAVEVEQRGGVAALAVDQYQHLVRRQAAQLRGADRAGAVAQCGAREVQRWQRTGQCGGQFRGAGGLQRLGADDVDRRLRFGHGAVGHAGAGDDDRIQGVGRAIGRRGGLCHGGEASVQRPQRSQARKGGYA